MVVGDVGIHNIMGGMENTAGVRLHNHRRKLKQRFDIIRKLGQGTYGKVQLGINKETGQEVAIKTIKKAKIETEADLVRIRREIQIMSSVQHPNIIHIYEVFENREKMVLVMEYAAGGELYDYLSERKVLSEQEARRIFRQIATAVYYCHKHKICHRDLKLENILLDEHGSAKIADFGLSNVFDEQRLLNTFCGSPLYASPEIVKGTPYHGPEVDCWSLGVLLYTLVYGAMPFDGSNFKRLVKQISQGDYFEPKKPSPASPLIRDMLTVPPARRADIEKICSHWWVNEDYTESCLEIAEELANQTPVRLDLLLSLAPPAPSVGSDKLLITKEQGGSDGAAMGTTMIPARCHSVGSLMELDHPSTDRRVSDFDKERFLHNEISSTEAPKRKLEEGISTEEANQVGSKRKERSRRRERDRSSDRRHHRSSSRNKHAVESNNKSLLESKDENLKSEQGEDMMDVDTDGSSLALQYIDTSLRESEETITGSVKAATSSVETMAGSSSAVPEQEHVEVTLKSPTKEKSVRKPVKKKCKAGDESEIADKTPVDTSDEKEVLIPSQIEGDVKDDLAAKGRKKKQVAAEAKVNDSLQVLGEKETLLVGSSKENDTVIDQAAQDLKDNKDSKESELKANTELNVGSSSTEGNVDIKERVASKPIEMPKKGVKARKSKGELSLGKLGSSSEKSSGANTPDDTASPPTRPMERRRSKIFETAEKFNSLLSGSSEPKSPTTEKPKKVFIPGVKVSDAKRAFERKSSLPEAIVPTLSKTSVPKKAPEVNSDATVKVTCQDNIEVSVAQKTEKKPMESSLLEINDKDQNGAKSNSVKNQQSLTSEKGNEKVHSDAGEAEMKPEEEDTHLQLIPALPVTDKIAQQEEARIKKLKDAVEIISNAIAEESKKESLPDSNKKISSSKPPVPASPDSKGRTKGIGVSVPTSPKSPPPSPLDPGTGKKTVRVQVAPNDVRLATIQVSTPEATKFPFNESDITKGESVQGAGEVNGPAEDVKSEIVPSKDSKGVEDGTGKKKSAKVEITLKSATLPRRKTSKAEIQLGSPAVPPVEFKTEVEHMVGTSLQSTKPTQRSEVAFPIAGVGSKTSAFRSLSSEPDEIPRTKPRERIIPIKLEDSTTEAPPVTSPPPARPPVPPLQPQRSLSLSQRSGSLSRQSTQDSDTEGPDTIHKSPREFIIPIAMEGGGYVTPRAGSLEPSASDESTSRSRQRSTSRFGRPRRMSSLLSDASEDEGFNSPFATLQRHSSLGRDDDDDKSFHMHRLRSSRPSRHPLEHADSLSSAEEDDDDDGFEILTAESLFSTLLSRVRSLTQRLNVEDASRPGFPSSRLMNQLKSIGHTSPSSFWNNVYAHQQEPLSRRLSESSQFSRSFSRDSELGSTPWRRSMSRDVSDCDSVYSETSSTTGTLPRGSARQEDGGMCDEAASETSSTASSFPSHYTPSLARRISHHYKHRSTDEELGGQPHSNINALQSHDDLSRREYSSSMGNSLSYLPSRDGAHYIPSSSRRLARTLSMRSATEERSRSGSRRRENVPPRRLSFLESRDIRSSGELYNKSSFHGSSHSDIDEYKKRDYLPPTRRTLRLLDNNSSSGLNHRGSSASDTGDFYTHKPWDTSSVLPPLPHNALSYSRRKDSSTARSYGRQRSADIIDSSYVSQLNRHVPARIVEAASENIHDRPKHSASLPSMVGGKGSGFRAKGSSRVPVSAGIQSGYRQSKPDNQSNESVLASVVIDNELTSTKENIDSSINVSKPVDADITEGNSTFGNDVQKGYDSEKRNRSQIPSLLRFRSSSLCRETGVSKSRNTGSEDDHTSSRSTPDRSILSKFFRQGSEERSTGRDDVSTENKEGTDGKKKTRRISRFLRPDFFDTPREESSFVKEKEAQKAAEEERKKAKRIARRAALLEKKEKEAHKLLNDKETLKTDCLEQTSNDKDETYSEIQSSVRETSLQTGGNDEDNSDAKFNSKPSDNTTTSNIGENAIEKSANGTNNKNRFLHSLEKKWEKFRSSGDDSNSTIPCGKSRVEKAIRSLRERSVAPRGSDLMTTESNLLKRAVSVDDMCTKVKVPITKGNNSSSSKLGSKVSSVLGLFRKMEDSPADIQKLPQAVNRPSLLLSRLRRTQSVYAGSHSDSVLHAHSQEILDSSASVAVVSESQGKDDANEFNESRNDSISNDVNSEIQKTVDSSVENITVPSSAGIVIANPSTNAPVQNAEKSQKTYSPAENITVPTSAGIVITNPSVNSPVQNADKSQKTHIKPMTMTSETPDGKSSNKVLGKTKVVKEMSHQKESMSVEKQKSGSMGISETSKAVSSKPAVVRKSNPKKVVGSSSSSKVTSGRSDTQKVKSAHLLDDGKELGKCVKNVSKSDGKKGSPHSEVLHNTQNIEENQQTVERTVPPPLPTAASQGGSVICETEIKLPEPKTSVTIEPNEPHTESATKSIHEVGSPQNKGAEASLMQTSDTTKESEGKSHETVNPKLEVDTQNCKKTPVVHPLTHDAAVHKVDVANSESCMVDLGGESSKSSLTPCDDSMNANEMKVAVVKKLDCCSKPFEEIAPPVSPIDECESLDSWSVCSDFESRDFSMSPLPYLNLDEEETESVEDRIRRKSFYSRFNDIKKKSHRKLSPSYVGTQNYSAQQHYKNQGSHSLYSPQDLGFRAPSYSRKTSLPTRSRSAINNSTTADNESQSYELHNGFDDSSLDQRKKSLEESIKTDRYLNSEEQKIARTVPPSNKSSRSQSHSDVDKQLKTGPSHLLRPTDFTQDVIRRSSISKSRLPTASWERRASTPVGSRLAVLSNKSARAGNQTDTTAPEGENLPLDGKYDRFTSESSPSS